ncbi:hypothetical protein IT779_05920 [Nocardia sp. NEAU-351]|uniref:Uncharacterized protein n=1 Tax=Nocardia bovistercoris TaxID=2785916 RepID=A0A931MZ69_9NOCA|nr:hypothetical protein [Nocardia bovistercoris]
MLSKVAAWFFFVGGIVAAVLGIAGLHVEVTVVGLILACTAGLVLLKLRTDTEAAAVDAETAADEPEQADQD